MVTVRSPFTKWKRYKGGEALGLAAQEGHGLVGASPQEDHEGAQRAGASLLQRQMEGVEIVQPGEGSVETL